MSYWLPTQLNEFQHKMYIHLIDWKKKHITTEAGTFKGRAYDAILPDDCVRSGRMPHVYPLALNHLTEHRKANPFRIHRHFYHMASSQAANINLFLPILHYSRAADILRAIRKDLVSLATDHLDHGYCIEYWGGNFGEGNTDKGLLGDKSAQAGTDADIAIAYRNQQGELCLWLIEHKLTEREFTECGGYKSVNNSRNRKRKASHDCGKPFSQILKKKGMCYYHDVLRYRYWEITEENKDFFPNHTEHDRCPFQSGMNQLWRNQLLSFELEKNGLYKHVHFSVVRHPGNEALSRTLREYQTLIDNNPKFSTFTSADVIQAAAQHAVPPLQDWIVWYKDVYDLP